MRHLERNCRTRHLSGFTLLELLVVIGIVSVLAGIVLQAGAMLARNADIEATRTTIQILDAALSEWERTSDRALTWWQTGDDASARARLDVHADTPEPLLINEVLNVIERSNDVRSMLTQVKPSYLYVYRKGVYPSWLDSDAERSVMDSRFDGSRTYLDAWGTPIYLIHPGRTWTADDNRQPYYFLRDDDDTIRTYNEEKYGIAPHRRIVFVSAGPDRRFGLIEEFGDLRGTELELAIAGARQDNIFSIEVKFAP